MTPLSATWAALGNRRSFHIIFADFWFSSMRTFLWTYLLNRPLSRRAVRSNHAIDPESTVTTWTTRKMSFNRETPKLTDMSQNANWARELNIHALCTSWLDYINLSVHIPWTWAQSKRRHLFVAGDQLNSLPARPKPHLHDLCIVFQVLPSIDLHRSKTQQIFEPISGFRLQFIISNTHGHGPASFGRFGIDIVLFWRFEGKIPQIFSDWLASRQESNDGLTPTVEAYHVQIPAACIVIILLVRLLVCVKVEIQVVRIFG